MEKTSEEYCSIINNSLLFHIEDRTSDEYVLEFRYLQQNVSEYYCRYVWKHKETYGLELVIAFRNCVKSYKKEMGDFVNYLAVAVNKNKRVSIAKERSEQMRGGIKLQGREEKQIRCLCSIVKSKGWTLEDDNIAIKLSNALGLSTEKVSYLLAVNSQATALSEAIELEDDVVSRFDQVADNFTPEKIFMDKENLISALEKLNKLVVLQSGGKRNIISCIVTIMLVNIDIGESLSVEKLKEFCFFDRELYEEMQVDEKKYSDSDIAKKFNVSKAYISKVRKVAFANLLI